jgi:hypothetical protein
MLTLKNEWRMLWMLLSSHVVSWVGKWVGGSVREARRATLRHVICAPLPQLISLRALRAGNWAGLLKKLTGVLGPCQPIT